jgi:uncharacterized membrane protein YgcG
MQKKIIALAVAATFFVTACGNDHSDAKQLPAQASAPVQQAAAAAPAAAQPVIVQQSAPAQSGASTGDMLLAAGAGYMLSNALNNRQAAPAPAVAPQPTTVINKTYVTKQYVQEPPKPAPAPVVAPAPAKPAVPSYTTPAPKQTTSYSASKPMSHSGGSSFSRSFSSSSRSFSSGRR